MDLPIRLVSFSSRSLSSYPLPRLDLSVHRCSPPATHILALLHRCLPLDTVLASWHHQPHPRGLHGPTASSPTPATTAPVELCCPASAVGSICWRSKERKEVEGASRAGSSSAQQ